MHFRKSLGDKENYGSTGVLRGGVGVFCIWLETELTVALVNAGGLTRNLRL